MREIKTEIQISSTPDKVWGILVDFPGWANWNPIVNKIEGNLEVGAELQITMTDKNGNDGKSYKSIVATIEENNCFGFIGSMGAKFIFSAERIIELEASTEGTLFKQKEVYSGLLVPLFWSKLSQQALPMLKAMNKALKKKVEA